MKGHIRKHGAGWQIAYYTRNANGELVHHYETVKGGKRAAQHRLAEIQVAAEKGLMPTSGSSTVGEYLREWLAGYVKTKCSARTLEGYSMIVNAHLAPAIGGLKLKNLSHQAIQRYYADAQEKLSARTVHHHHRVLSEALKYAVKQGYLGRNPCDMVDAPRPKKKPMRTLTPAELDVLLRAAAEMPDYPIPHYAIIYTAVSSGLRQGELLALRWRDVDLDLMSISVSRALYKRRGVTAFKTPKSRLGHRSVTMTPKLALFLRQYRDNQLALRAELKKPLTLDDLVFPNLRDGGPADPSVVSHAFQRIARQAGLEGVHFHTLRHSFASLMLMRGAKPKVISEALGHASVAFTMDTYSHIIDGMQEQAMQLLNEVLPDGIVQKNSAKIVPKN